MTPSQEKLLQKLKACATFIIEEGITKSDILDMCLEDDAVTMYIGIMRNNSDLYEWRKHPIYPEIECSTEGEVRVSGKIIKPTEWDGKLKISISRKKKLYAAQLILTAFKPMPTDGKYAVGFRDCDYTNLSVLNLYWHRLI